MHPLALEKNSQITPNKRLIINLNGRSIPRSLTQFPVFYSQNVRKKVSPRQVASWYATPLEPRTLPCWLTPCASAPPSFTKDTTWRLSTFPVSTSSYTELSGKWTRLFWSEDDAAAALSPRKFCESINELLRCATLFRDPYELPEKHVVALNIEFII